MACCTNCNDKIIKRTKVNKRDRRIEIYYINCGKRSKPVHNWHKIWPQAKFEDKKKIEEIANCEDEDDHDIFNKKW